ncbi:archaeosortase/exosortase family protein [Prochlorococcus marinus]|uniref:Cyanoexosortase A n=1 Tax=Prochlorococcus marinus str. SB TaxID=59926 RepID=A0A0A2B5F6_PROMR|nr:archaeosortase/exosortase family protein [Prochlorococcus marinus]KGG09051.1 hypothetical protein EV02_1729 [Prochlorococcus marinus str. SB]
MKLNIFLKKIETYFIAWFLLYAFLVGVNILINYKLKTTGDTQLFNLLIWISIFLSLEDQKRNLYPDISKINFAISLFFLVIIIFQLNSISIENNNYLYLLPLEISFMMAFLNKKINNLRIFIPSFIFTFLYALRPVILKLFDPIFVNMTSWSSWIGLNMVGFKGVFLNNSNEIILKTSGVKIYNGCSGVDMIVFTLSILIVCSIIYPFPKPKINILIFGFGAILSFFINVIRICLLAFFNNLDSNLGSKAFEFFHISYGSQIFHIISIILSLTTYMFFLERQLSKS